MSNMKKLSIVILAIMALFTSCAVNQDVPYENVTGDISFEGNNSVAIAVWDQREMIVNGARKPNFVGYMRSGVGIAYPMGTETKENFADVIAENMAATLNKNGFSATPVKTEFIDSQDDIVSKLTNQQKDRSLLLILNEYHTDCYGLTNLMLNLDIKVYDQDGNLLAEKNIRESKGLGGDPFWGAGDYKNYIPENHKDVLEKILSADEIKKALQ